MAGVTRAQVVARAGTLAAALAGLPVAILGAAPPAAADAPIDDVCDTTTVGTTITLNGDCVTTEALTVPDGFTLNGGGNTISAENPPGAHTYTGAVVTNAAGATSMNLENLTVTGPETGFPFTIPAPSCNTDSPNGFPGLFGIFFNDASGSVNNVEVRNIFQTFTGPGSPACNTGHTIRADGVTAARTVTITDTQVSGYQKGGMFASGRMTMNVSGSTIGPPSFVPFSIGQNGVQWTNSSTRSSPAVGASGTMTASTIIGSSYSETGPTNPAASSSAAVLLYGASDVTIDKNTITRGSDLGISVTAGTAKATISYNAINRPEPPAADPYGIGVSVDADLADTTDLICNTFDGWNTDIEGDIQIGCPLPDGAECEAYSATSTVIGDATEPFAWTLVSGDLPPGLSLAPNGEITGTLPDDSADTYEFALGITDADGLTATSDQTITIAPGCATPTPSPTQSAAPAGGGAQPVAVPTAVAAGVPAAAGPDRRQPTAGVDLPLLAAGAALLGAAGALTVIGGRRRRSGRH